MINTQLGGGHFSAYKSKEEHLNLLNSEKQMCVHTEYMYSCLSTKNQYFSIFSLKLSIEQLKVERVATLAMQMLN